MNKVPKPWAEKDQYCQMIHNNDANNPDYAILPRMWAFEISTVIENVDILFFSKLMSRMWPNVSAVTDRIKNFAADSKTMNGVELRAKYYTKGLHTAPIRLTKSIPRYKSTD